VSMIRVMSGEEVSLTPAAAPAILAPDDDGGERDGNPNLAGDRARGFAPRGLCGSHPNADACADCDANIHPDVNPITHCYA